MSGRDYNRGPMHALPGRWLLIAACAAGACAPGSDRGVDEPPGEARGELAAEPVAEPALAARIRELEEIGYASGYEVAPEVDGVTLLDRERVMPGLNLVVSAHAAEAVLMDLEGRVVHRWARSFEDTWPGRSGSAERRGSWRRAYLLPGGDLLAIFTALGVVRLDRDSNVLWTWDGRAHHALDVADDGTIYVLSRRAVVIPEMHPSEPILEDLVTRLAPDGHELGTVSIRDCLLASEHAAILDEIQHTGDVFHTNAVQWLDGATSAPAFARGGLLVSVRQLDLLLVLDLEGVGVRWAGRGAWRRQHEPTLLPGGTMLVFDNLSVAERSGVIEFDPLTGAELWVHRPEGEQRFFSSGCGTCQRLSNGNTLITVSNSGFAFEVTPAGERVWQWHSPYRAGAAGELVATLFDVHRLPPDCDTSWIDR